ncbi:radical SAM/SPASM domain-containing protein [Methanococcus maripaludis]|uniref:Radical SAM protein with 4Fe4S-binding SPASM domain n=1 Tax=Methanococcus maripaludis TaxID=39152 RepID=A0A7J9PQS7_METMI|nr:radical SAM/SPASM domain-containing protein [Methanococcus maripaludis]MBA2868486.1 radical SAM protein with 4Fe4S-binding SPASM domain [Methanococcus maripaludis]
MSLCNVLRKLYTRQTDLTVGKCAYATILPLLKNKKPKKPLFIKIETVNYCNSQCKYCPHPKMTRKKGFIGDELFDKLANELVIWGVKEVHLTNFGESLLDPKIVERIDYLKNLDEELYIKIITNGFGLSEKNIDKILNSKLDEIQVSFDGFSKEHYEFYRTPFKYENIKDKITNLISERNKRNSKLVIKLNTIYNSKEISERQLKEFKDSWNSVNGVNIQKLHNWSSEEANNNVNGCIDIYSYMTILRNGDVVPCCLDFDGNINLGNCNDNTLQEIWENEKYTNFRNLVFNDIGSIDLCKNCMMAKNKERPYYALIQCML